MRSSPSSATARTRSRGCARAGSSESRPVATRGRAARSDARVRAPGDRTTRPRRRRRRDQQRRRDHRDDARRRHRPARPTRARSPARPGRPAGTGPRSGSPEPIDRTSSAPNPIPAAAAVEPVTVLPRNVRAAQAAQPEPGEHRQRDPARDRQRLEQDRRVDPGHRDGQRGAQAEDRADRRRPSPR